MNSILVLGGAGFVGRSLIKKLITNKFRVKALVYKKDIPYNIEKFKGDILSPGILNEHIENGDIIINLIGQLTGSDVKFSDLNIKGGLNLLQSCLNKKNVKIILISSLNVYGENLKRGSKESDLSKPTTIYGNIKLLTEKIYQNYSDVHDRDVTVLRLSNLYGPEKKSGPISNMISSLKNKKYFSAYNNGKQLRDFIFIEDATDGILAAIKNSQRGFQIFNISTGKRYMIKNVAKLIEKISKKKLRIRLNPKIPDERCIWANNSRAKRILKFSPKITLEKGLKFTIDYYRQKENWSTK
ncbi:MAG: NAD-dependent epimerase/dehydratase family protein [Nitrosarchaeum sp.]